MARGCPVTAKHRGIPLALALCGLTLTVACVGDNHGAGTLSVPSVVATALTAGAANPPAQDVVLSNRGDCALAYTASVTTTDGLAWLRVAQGASGTVEPGAQATLQLGFEAQTLPPGTFVGSVLVTGACTSNGRIARRSPVAIAVSLTVKPAPVVPPNCPSKVDGEENESVAQPACNDTVATADRYVHPALLTGALQTASDVDLYRFEVDEAASVFIVDVRPAQDAPLGSVPRPIVDVLGPDGSVFALGPSGPELDDAGASSREVFFPTAGTYYARVRNSGAGAFGADARYTLTLSRQPLESLERFFPIDETLAINAPSASLPTVLVPRVRLFLEGGSSVLTSVLAARNGFQSALDYRLFIYDVEDLSTPVLVTQNDDESTQTTDPGLSWSTGAASRYYLVVVDWRGPLTFPQSLRLKTTCAPGTLPFQRPNTAGPTCLPVPSECAPPVPAACAQRPNLIVNGGFEAVPAQRFDPPPGWSPAAQPTIHDVGCDEGSQLPDCYGFPTTFFGTNVAPGAGRRFGGVANGIAQVLAPLQPGRTYHLSALVRQSNAGGLDGAASLQAHLASDVFDLTSTSPLGLACPTSGPGAAFAQRAFTFVAPADAASRPVFSLSAVGQSLEPSNHALALDEVQLVDITSCP